MEKYELSKPMYVGTLTDKEVKAAIEETYSVSGIMYIVQAANKKYTIMNGVLEEHIQTEFNISYVNRNISDIDYNDANRCMWSMLV